MSVTFQVTSKQALNLTGETVQHELTVDTVPNPILNPIANPNRIPKPNLNRYCVLTVLYPLLGRVIPT